MLVAQADGGKWGLRAGSAETIRRWYRKRYYISEAAKNKEIKRLLDLGAAIQISADMSTLLRIEMMVSDIVINGSFVLRMKLDVDGCPIVDTFATSYESPVLSMEGKTAADLADRLLQILIFREIVPEDTTLECVHENLVSAVYAFHSDKGSENVDANSCQRGRQPDGGAYGLLMVQTDSDGGRIRNASFLSCGPHDLHNWSKATQSHPEVYAAMTSCAKFLRFGMRKAHYEPLAKYIAGASDTNPLTGTGATIADKCRADIASWTTAEDKKALDNAVDAPGDTRFGSSGPVAQVLNKIKRPMAAAVTIIEAKKDTFEQCTDALKRNEEGTRKAAKFVEMLSDLEISLHMEISEVKHTLVFEPLLRAYERSHHCSSTLVCGVDFPTAVDGTRRVGTGGSLQVILRRLKRSVITYDLRKLSSSARAMVHSARALPSTREKEGATLVIPGSITLPRWSTWEPVLKKYRDIPIQMGGLQQRCHAVLAIVRWVNSAIADFEERLTPPISRLELQIAAVAREWGFVECKEDHPSCLRTDPESWGPCARAAARRSSLPSTSSGLDAATGNTAGARMTVTSAIEGTCYEAKLSGAVDLEVRAIAPLDDRPHGLPTFPSPLELFAAKGVLGIWGALDENSRSSHPPSVRQLFDPHGDLRAQLEEFSEQKERNPKTRQFRPLRCWPDLHEHLYKYFALLKMTAVDRENAFSILKCFILKGNYHVSLERLSGELDLAKTGGRSRIREFTEENMKEGSELEARVANWRPSKEVLWHCASHPPHPRPSPWRIIVANLPTPDDPCPLTTALLTIPSLFLPSIPSAGFAR